MRADRDADHDQPREAVGQEIGGRAGRHHHGDDEEGADRLQRRDRAGAKQREEHDLQSGRIEPDRAGVALVEEDDHQVLPLDEQHGERDEADDGELQRVLRA